MNIKTYENCAVYADDYFILAKSAVIASSNFISPQFTVDRRFRNSSYVPDNGIRHSISISYYPLGYDALNKLSEEDRACKLQIGDMTFEAYLVSISVSAQYAQPLTVQANLEAFKDYDGELGDARVSNSELSIFKDSPLKIPNTLVSAVENSMSVSIPMSASYSYSTEWTPVFRVNSPTVDEIRYGKKRKEASIEGENIGRFISVEGSNGSIKITPKDLCFGPLDQLIYRYFSNYDIDETLRNSIYLCDGKIVRHDINIGDDPIVMGSFSVESWL